MTVVIFLGPSLPLDEARLIFPNAIYRPPAAQGDILTAVEQDGAEIIGLIDGTFLQSLSVWHNELCYVLSRGVAVYGASSMGALRAVETERFGTVGIGRIFKWYRDGIINSDDEVALAHGDATMAFRQTSIPLVNIRASLEQAIAAALIDEFTAKKVIDAVRTIYFPDRSRTLILRRCRETGIEAEPLLAVERALTIDYVDLKKQDACELLTRIQKDLAAGHVPVPPPFTFSRSSVFETLYNLDRHVRHDGVNVPLQLIGEHFALHCPEFGEARRSALNHGVVVFFAGLLGVKASTEDLAAEEAEFLKTRKIEEDGQLADWLRANDFSLDDFHKLIYDMAVARCMQRWIQHIHGFDRGSKYLLNELRQQGVYVEWARRAARESAIANAYREQGEYHNIPLRDPRELAEEHGAATGVRITGDAKAWAANAGFDGDWGLREALQRSAIARDVQQRIDRIAQYFPAGAESQA